MQVDFKVETSVDDEEGLIVQDTYQVQGDQVLNHVQSIVDTQNEQTKQALIALGWTPPAKTPKIII